jgi:signal transduction histidine kinase
VKFDRDLRRVYGDSRQLQQVLLNLVINAEQAMSSSTRRELIVTARNAGERVVVEVRDTGNGIPSEARRRIFEPFFTTKPEGTGTGLGLSVSYGIVRAHGGTLALGSSSSSGTTFRMTLPALLAPDTNLDGEE